MSTKKVKKKKMTSEEAQAAIELNSNDEYQHYVKEHARRMRNLRRDVSGEYEPEDWYET